MVLPVMHRLWIAALSRPIIAISLFVLPLVPGAYAQQKAMLASLAALPDAPGFPASEAAPQSSLASPYAQPAAQVISGTVRDARGAALPGATVTLTPEQDHPLLVTTDAEGHFTLSAPPAGLAVLTVTFAGFRAETQTLDLRPGQVVPALQIRLSLATATTDVEVTATREEIGAAQVAAEEKQRVLGIFPNYFVTYAGNAVPLTTHQKFALTGKLEFDPVTLGLNAVFAGVEQAENAFPGYGQGAAGFGKRLGATFADSVDSSFLGGAILPTLFRQDPRYFFRGPGHSRANRALYAIASVVICKGDNGKWQPNYSNVGGNVAAAGISNLYYPASDRHGATLTVDNALLGTAEGAVGALIEEFLIRHITPNLPPYDPAP